MRILKRFAWISIVCAFAVNCSSSEDSDIKGVSIADGNGGITYYRAMAFKAELAERNTKELLSNIGTASNFDYCVFKTTLSASERKALALELQENGIRENWMEHFAFVKNSQSGIERLTEHRISLWGLKRALNEDESAVAALLRPNLTMDKTGALKSADFETSIKKSDQHAGGTRSAKSCSTVKDFVNRLAEVQATIQTAPQSDLSQENATTVLVDKESGSQMAINTGNEVIDFQAALNSLNKEPKSVIDVSKTILGSEGTDGNYQSNSNDRLNDSTTVISNQDQKPTSTRKSGTEGLFSTDSETWKLFKAKTNKAKEKKEKQQLFIQPDSYAFSPFGG